MTLAKDEVVIKKWDYAKIDQKELKTTSTLEVTNKRVVHTVESQNLIARSEVMIDAIQGVSYKYETEKINPSKKGFVAMIILGILIGIFGILSNQYADAPIYATVLFAIVGLLLLFSGVLNLRSAKSEVDGMFYVEIKALGVTEEFMGIQKKKVFATDNGVILIKVDGTLIKEIIDTLGAIIIENKK